MLGKNWTVIASAVIAVLLIGGAWYYGSFPPQAPQEAAKPKFDKSKLVGKQTFQISQGEAISPKFKEITIDPLDVKVGDVQKFEAVMQPGQKIESVAVTTNTDNKEVRVVLAPIPENPDVFRGEWTVHDTTDNIYQSIFTARGDGKESKVELAWSDPCTPPLGGDWRLDSACSAPASVTGADNGNIIFVTTNTLTVPAGGTVAFNSGFNIQLGSASGTIALSGQIRNTNIWIRDQDNDLYAPNATDQLAQDSQPANYQRRNTRTNTTDCCDTEANAHPGQTSFFTVARSVCGGFDYNCINGDEKQYPDVNSCP